MTSVREVGRFEVRSRPDRGRVIVAVSGELDIATVGVVQAALDELYAVGWKSVVFDLRELSFIDSMGLSLLLEAERTAQRSGAAFAIVDGLAGGRETARGGRARGVLPLRAGALSDARLWELRADLRAGARPLGLRRVRW